MAIKKKRKNEMLIPINFRREESGWRLWTRVGGAWGREWVEPWDKSGWSLGTRVGVCNNSICSLHHVGHWSYLDHFTEMTTQSRTLKQIH